MAQIDILEEKETFVPDTSMGMGDDQEQARFAAEDLQRIEEDAKREAEAYVEAADGDGNERDPVEAAGTAFDFDEAEYATAEFSGQVEANMADDWDDWDGDGDDDDF